METPPPEPSKTDVTPPGPPPTMLARVGSFLAVVVVAAAVVGIFFALLPHFGWLRKNATLDEKHQAMTDSRSDSWHDFTRRGEWGAGIGGAVGAVLWVLGREKK